MSSHQLTKSKGTSQGSGMAWSNAFWLKVSTRQEITYYYCKLIGDTSPVMLTFSFRTYMHHIISPSCWTEHGSIYIGWIPRIPLYSQALVEWVNSAPHSRSVEMRSHPRIIIMDCNRTIFWTNRPVIHFLESQSCLRTPPPPSLTSPQKSMLGHAHERKGGHEGSSSGSRFSY